MKKFNILFVIITICFSAFSQTPTITSFTPASGPVGTLVTITGTNLSTPTAFTIGGVSAVVVSDNGTTLVGMVMPGATTGSVSVSTAGGSVAATGSYTITATPYPIAQIGSLLQPAAGTAPATSLAISADGTTAAILTYNTYTNSSIPVIYIRAGNSWVQQATISSLLPRYIDGGNKYLALSADGNTLALGNAIVNAQDTGSVSIYVRSGTNWQKQGPDLVGTGGINTGSGIEQGSTLALSADGNTLIEGGGADNGGTGAVWVFVRTDTTWSQQGAKLIGTGASSYGGGAGQGGAMAISADGNTLIEGGGADSNGMGAVWVFIRSGSTWTQQGGKIKATANPSDASSFGNSLAISADGNTALIGAFTDSGGIGSAYVYTRSSGIWTQQRRLVGSHSHTDNFMYQGYSVGLSADGNTAVSGGIEDSSAMGAVWAFTRSGTTWTQPGPKLVGSGVTWALPVFQGYLALSADGAMMIEIGSFEINDDGAMWTFGRNSCTDTTIYIAHAICQGDTFTFGNKQYAAQGTYNDTLTNVGGCDSIVTLQLTVNPLPVVSLSWDSLVRARQLGHGAPYLQDTFWCGFYPVNVTLVGGEPPGGTYSGYNVSNGVIDFSIYHGVMDTVYYTVTDSNHCTNTALDTIALNVFCDGITEVSGGAFIHLYPNPNHGSFTLETSNSIGSEYTISDMLGNVIANDVIKANEQSIEVKEASEGVYTLVVRGAQPLRFVVVR